MKSVRLIAVEDEFDNRPGLAIKGTNTGFDGFMACRDGVNIAHDLLEHQNGPENIGPVWDELEAIGAIWQVRGRWGDLLFHVPNMHGPDQNLASDVARMFRDGIDDYCPPAHRYTHTRRVDCEEDFDAILDMALKAIRAEEYGDLEGMGKRRMMALAHIYLTEARHRMRIGYRKAQRRFGHDSKGYDLFRAIRDAANQVAMNTEFAGQEFQLWFSGTTAAWREIDLDY